MYCTTIETVCGEWPDEVGWSVEDGKAWSGDVEGNCELSFSECGVPVTCCFESTFDLECIDSYGDGVKFCFISLILISLIV